MAASDMLALAASLYYQLQNHYFDERVKDAKVLSSTLKEMTTELQAHGRYVTHKRGEPPIVKKMQPLVVGTEAQRKRAVIHTLVRADDAGERPSALNQKVPGFAGLQAMISATVERSKAYYFMAYPDPPKKTVLNDVMLKVTGAIERKHMPFAVVVGDQPVYTLLVEIKSEHPEKYANIIPFLGPFHTQCCMIYAIYKRHKGSELAEVLVAAGVIADGSVDHALRGKHYRRAIRCLKPGVHTNDFATIHGRPARIHTAPAESTVDSTYCLPQALCEYARGDRESWRNR